MVKSWWKTYLLHITKRQTDCLVKNRRQFQLGDTAKTRY